MVVPLSIYSLLYDRETTEQLVSSEYLSFQTLNRKEGIL
jgi:hypothetical protein